MAAQLIKEESRRFPALTPEGGWQPADFEDLFGDFLVDRLRKVTANLLAQASDDASMGRLLRRSIRYWLIDRARSETATGALRRRLEAVLAAEDVFEQVPEGEVGAGRWRMAGTSGPPWSGQVEDLVVAARSVRNVKIPKWSSATRRPPPADRASLVTVASTVLTSAGGSVEVAQLVAVFVARFPVVLDPVIGPLTDDVEGGLARDEELTPEERVLAVEEELDAGVAAAQIVGMLAPLEREIVPYLDNVLAIQEVLGCRRSQAYHHAQRLKEKLAQLVGEGDDVRAVGLEVIRLCGGAAVTR